MDSYEQKYKEALERAKAMIKVAANQDEAIGFANTIFPELKESEDEKIRKALICGMYALKEQHKTCFASIPIDNAIAWLEKQGENHVVGNNEMVKPADKVKLKFHEGDWVVCDGWTTQIVAVYEDGYANSSQGFIPLTGEHSMRLWDVSKDAKDGDVLVASDGSIFLFAGVVDWGCKYYAALTTDGAVKLSEGLEHFWETSRAVHPATKEQRDALMKAMTDAGHTFDFEKKELKEIKQRPTWSETDNFMYNRIKNLLTDISIAPESRNSLFYWLKSLKGRVQPKQEWSKEDESIALGIEQIVNCASLLNVAPDRLNKVRDWLKSLKQRIGG